MSFGVHTPLLKGKEEWCKGGLGYGAVFGGKLFGGLCFDFGLRGFPPGDRCKTPTLSVQPFTDHINSSSSFYNFPEIPE